MDFTFIGVLTAVNREKLDDFRLSSDGVVLSRDVFEIIGGDGLVPEV